LKLADALDMLQVMIRTIAVAAALLTCTACGKQPQRTPATAYVHWGDRLRASAPAVVESIFPPCTKKNGRYLDPTPIDECYKLQAPQRWRGIWVTEFEGYRFCPAPAQTCSGYEQPRYSLWLNPKVFGHPPQIGVTLDHSYSIGFIGRRTQYRVGGWAPYYVIVVDRLISIRDLGLLPGHRKAEI
jgi:hypothetical protein